MRPNYQHDHWEGLPDPLVMPAHDIEVYSTYVYVPPTHQVIYKSTILGDITDKTANIDFTDTAGTGTTVTIRTDRPTREGYVFGEWYYSDLQGRHTSGQTFTMPDRDVTIYGHFYDEDSSENIPGMYKITYKYRLYPGHVPAWFTHCYQHYHEGDTIVLPDAPVFSARPQYQHDHWDNVPENLIMPNHDVEITSTFVYVGITHTIVYRSMVHGDITGRTNVDEYTDTCASGFTYTIRTNVPTRQGYVFGEWYYSDLTGRHTSGQTITMPDQDIIIYGEFYDESSSDQIPGMYTIKYEWLWNSQELNPWHTWGYQHYHAGDTIVPPTPNDYTYMTYTYRHRAWTGLPDPLVMPANDLTARSTFYQVMETYNVKYYTRKYEDLSGTKTLFQTDTCSEGASYSLTQSVPALTGYLFDGWTQMSYMRSNGVQVTADISGNSITIPHSENDEIIFIGYFKLDSGEQPIAGYKIATFYWRIDNRYYIGKEQKHYRPGDTIVYPEVPNFTQQGYEYHHVEWTNAPADDIMPDNDITITSWMQRVTGSYTVNYYGRWNNAVDGQGQIFFQTVTDVSEGALYKKCILIL